MLKRFRLVFFAVFSIVLAFSFIAIKSNTAYTKSYTTPAIESLDDDYIKFDVFQEKIHRASELELDETTSLNNSQIAGSATKPNILLIIIDDIPQIDRRLWNRMPTLSKFVKEGVEFTEAHVVSPWCCPGRGGLLSARYTHNHRLYNPSALNKFDESMTVATQVDKEGYRTLYSGKFENHYADISPDERLRLRKGWDVFVSFDRGYYNYHLVDNKNRKIRMGNSPKDYSTDVFANRLVNSISNSPADQSIFAVYSPYAIHVDDIPAPRHIGDKRCNDIKPWNSPNYKEVDRSDKPEYVRNTAPVPWEGGFPLRKKCEMLLSVDDGVRRITNELQRQGRLDDTWVFIVADNGMNWGAHGLDAKVAPYASGIPLIAWNPSILGSTGKKINEPVLNIDLPVTIAEIAGSTFGPYKDGQKTPDGKSFFKLLTGASNSMERDELFLEITQNFTARNIPKYNGIITQPGEVWDKKWLYVEYGTGERELYDLSNGPCHLWSKGDSGDPCRLKNRLGPNSNPSQEIKNLVKKLSERLAELRVERGQPEPTITPTLTLTTSPSPDL